MKGTTTFLFGLALGILAVVVTSRVRHTLSEDDPNALADKLTEKLDELDRRAPVAKQSLKPSIRLAR